MENDDITRILKFTAKLMEIHDENEFKIKSFYSAVFNLEKISDDIAEMSSEQRNKIEGVGKGILAKLDEIIATHTLAELDILLDKTPKGIIDLLSVKGLGPSKVKSLWREHKIENIKSLKLACEEGVLASLKGFGEKTQSAILQELLFAETQQDKWLFSVAERVSLEIEKSLNLLFPNYKIASIGQIARAETTISGLSFLVETQKLKEDFQILVHSNLFLVEMSESGPMTLRGKDSILEIPIEVLFVEPSEFTFWKWKSNSMPKHLSYIYSPGESIYQTAKSGKFESEEKLYHSLGINFIPAECRNGSFELDKNFDATKLVQYADLTGIFHAHSTYSDGKHTLREMAISAKEKGFLYLGITDHSQSAFYANGLKPDRIIAQHAEIEMLNKELFPFVIFKGIESDILNDGALDYEDEVLQTFDFVIASVHSNLKMNEEKANLRLIKAIENPYTTMLGHPTGRLLLKREGYPINHDKIIDACAANKVAIEINANPWRLDIDWIWVQKAQDKGVIISINPDSHEKETYNDMKYGIWAARKGGLLKENTLNAQPIEFIQKWFAEGKSK